MSATEGRLGVLLMTYGSPADLDEIPAYLAAVRGGRAADEELVVEFQRRYRVIGGSPLIAITQAQAAALQTRLRADGLDARATAGMRFSLPSVANGLATLAGQGCSEVVGIIMSPQYSPLLMAGYEGALADAVQHLDPAAPTVRLAAAWFREDGFVRAVAERIHAGLRRLPPEERERAPVLLTAHSLPRRVADREPEYLEQLRTTAELIAERAELSADRWHFCWQSAGHEPGEWMKPDFADLVPELRRAGHRSVLVAPVQFLADHLEILYDVDVGAREQAERAQMAFARIESLNLHPDFIGALAATARAAGREPVLD